LASILLIVHCMILNDNQRKKVSDLLSGLAQIIVGALVVGQFFPTLKGAFNISLTVLGIIIALASCAVSIRILKKED